MIIVVSFLPVFLLEAQEGRMFRPLAWTKTLAVGFSSILAITLVPVLMIFFIRGRLTPGIAKSDFQRSPRRFICRFCGCACGFAKPLCCSICCFSSSRLPLAFHIGSQFMPPLFEGSSLYMPTALPGISIAQASQLLQEQDRIIRTFPEVETVFGSVGRSDSATDNAPLDMYDTTVMLKPREQWRPGMTYEKLIQEMDAKLQFPGSLEHLDDAGRKPPRHGVDGHQDAARSEDSGTEPGGHPAGRRPGAADAYAQFPRCGPFLPNACRKAFTSTSK